MTQLIAEATLRRFAERGLSADLTPTMDCSDTGRLYAGFSSYLRRLDQSVRESASRALQASAARPEVVVLCGSTRFKDAFRDAAKAEALAGRIVLTVSDLDPRPEARHVNVPIDAETKARLDELHKRKIDLADRVLVLNVGGYIGESTRSEIEYAEAHGKPIAYLESDPVATPTEPTILARLMSLEVPSDEEADERGIDGLLATFDVPPGRVWPAGEYSILAPASPVPAVQPPTFEQLLTDPLEQFDTRSELLPAVLEYLAANWPMADDWSPPDIGQHGLDESCDNCRGGSEPSPDYSLMPRSFCPFVSGERRG